MAGVSVVHIIIMELKEQKKQMTFKECHIYGFPLITLFR
jgi:hypothetical protein